MSQPLPVIRLLDSVGDYLDVIVHDDLTFVDDLHAVARGYSL